MAIILCRETLFCVLIKLLYMKRLSIVICSAILISCGSTKVPLNIRYEPIADSTAKQMYKYYYDSMPGAYHHWSTTPKLITFPRSIARSFTKKNKIDDIRYVVGAYLSTDNGKMWNGPGEADSIARRNHPTVLLKVTVKSGDIYYYDLRVPTDKYGEPQKLAAASRRVDPICPKPDDCVP